MLTIGLPWPNSKLAPNRVRGHWAKTSGIRAASFEAAFLLAHHAVNNHRGEWFDPNGTVPVTLTFRPPDKRRRDLDGLLSSMKQAVDGVATALAIDDSRFSPITLARGEPVKGGLVIMEVGK